MHYSAARILIKNRAWDIPLDRLPLPKYSRLHQQMRSLQGAHWQRQLVSLAFTVVTELSIDSYLILVGQNKEIQPINSVTASLHWRDEKCHSSIGAEMAKMVFSSLNEAQRDFFMGKMVRAAQGLSEQDFPLWRTIVDLADIENGHQMLDECAEIPGAKHIVRDDGAIHRLWLDLNSDAGGRYDELLMRNGVPGVTDPIPTD